MAEAHDMRRSPNRIVQVPMDAALIELLDTWAGKLGRSRSDLIREACKREVKRLEREEIDRQIEEGYARIPQDPAIAIAAGAAMAQILEPEEW